MGIEATPRPIRFSATAAAVTEKIVCAAHDTADCAGKTAGSALKNIGTATAAASFRGVVNSAFDGVVVAGAAVIVYGDCISAATHISVTS